MSSDWINKAKQAAKQAGEEAKKLAEAAKNANYGEMLDKTKNMAKQAADEAKKAAGSIMNKDKAQPQEQQTESQSTVAKEPEVIITPKFPEVATIQNDHNSLITAKIELVEQLLKDIKQLL